MSSREEFDFLELESYTEHQWRRFLVNELFDIKEKQDLTNSRITKLEAFRLFSVGAVAVLILMVAPLILEAVGDRI